MRHTTQIAVAFVLILTACGGGDTVADGDGTTLAPTSPSSAPTTSAPSDPGPLGDWLLAGGEADGQAVPIVEGWRITLSVTEGQLGGTAACNGYGAEFTAAGGTITIGPVSQTEMACEPPVMDSERAYLTALRRVATYQVGEEGLLLAGDGVELRFEALAPVPTAALVDTTWELDTLIDGETAASVLGEPALLELHSEGTLVGSTGCRELEGRWTEAGDTIVFTEFSAVGECSSELRAQDDHVVTVLGDGFTAEIDGQRLTLMSPGDIGLSYVAR